MIALLIWYWLEVQVVLRADSRALLKMGNKIAAMIAMIAMTTRSSTSVNALRIVAAGSP